MKHKNRHKKCHDTITLSYSAHVLVHVNVCLHVHVHISFGIRVHVDGHVRVHVRGSVRDGVCVRDCVCVRVPVHRQVHVHIHVPLFLFPFVIQGHDFGLAMNGLVGKTSMRRVWDSYSSYKSSFIILLIIYTLNFISTQPLHKIFFPCPFLTDLVQIRETF